MTDLQTIERLQKEDKLTFNSAATRYIAQLRNALTLRSLVTRNWSTLVTVGNADSPSFALLVTK